MPTNIIITPPSFSPDLNTSDSNDMDDLMKILEEDAKMFHQYFQPLKNKDFELFKEGYKNYIIKTNKLSSEDFKFSVDIMHLKELHRCFENYPSDVEQLAIFFEKAHLVSPTNLLMLFYTQRCNDEISRRYNQEPCYKYQDYWKRGIKVSEDHFTKFCRVFQKDNFHAQKDDFFSNQDKHILKYYLEENLDTTDRVKKKKKI